MCYSSNVMLSARRWIRRPVIIEIETKEGDTMHSLAHNTGLDFGTLLAANGGNSARAIPSPYKRYMICADRNTFPNRVRCPEKRRQLRFLK